MSCGIIFYCQSFAVDVHFSLQNEWTDNVIGFHMPTYRACKNLWKTCVEFHTFYRFVSNGYVINFLWRAFKVVCLKLESGLLSLKISRFLLSILHQDLAR